MQNSQKEKYWLPNTCSCYGYIILYSIVYELDLWVLLKVVDHTVSSTSVNTMFVMLT